MHMQGGVILNGILDSVAPWFGEIAVTKRNTRDGLRN